ncbi:thiol oxidoreductase [Reichenbachiella sp. 5M10]|uniref:di-heme oxidoreductase family protein n=1 Tax=Reichenbachiella sp. 5M10 TaxID=1889772 RepID=UPI000C508633|nr:di-heme oxidoredictase family protein [Reichenbachiella sp. 5M10]PIB36641.1 thiol oxidoreductase [Reichenbachiella sp. 5M10]
MNKIYMACLGMLLLASCQSDEGSILDELEPQEQFLGGETSVIDESVNAFGQAAPNLTGNKDLEFVTGNAFFKRNWVTAPSSTEDLDGVGPLFNARSCSSCHDKDGRGAPPLDPTEEPVSLLFRLSIAEQIDWQPLPDPNYGGQFNHLSILGVEPEGKVSVTYDEISGNYPDGATYSLRKPSYHFYDLHYGDMSPNLMVSPRIAPHMIGLGLLEAVSEQTLLNYTDEADSDGDGISGRANYVEDVVTGLPAIGRFGWKANQPSVRQQVAGAFLGDIGITSALFPNQDCATNQLDCQEAYSETGYELTDQILDRVTLYSAALAVPRRRNWDQPNVIQGKLLFDDLNCSGCHITKMTTASHLDFPEFDNQTIRPFTDLLLHDMGEGLADHRPDGLATGTEWRTPPLWGIGLFPVVSGHTFYLHDGRARNLEEAILWHGGEASASVSAFKSLNQTERNQVLQFLESL